MYLVISFPALAAESLVELLGILNFLSCFCCCCCAIILCRSRFSSSSFRFSSAFFLSRNAYNYQVLSLSPSSLLVNVIVAWRQTDRQIDNFSANISGYTLFTSTLGLSPGRPGPRPDWLGLRPGWLVSGPAKGGGRETVDKDMIRDSYFRFVA